MIRNNTTDAALAAAAALGAGLLLMSAVFSTAHAQDAPAPSQPPEATTSEAVDVEVFQAARFLAYPNPNKVDPYPYTERRLGEEGWVELNMMIDTKGKPYEIMVINSSGNPALETAAVKLTGASRFEPARRGKAHIDSSLRWKVTFAIDRPAKPSDEFLSAYKEAAKAIDAGEKEAAEAQLAKLHSRTLYEDAFQHYIESQYHRRWGTPEQQLVDLQLAIAGEKKAKYLPEEAFKAALIQMFSLDVKTRNYGGALQVWKTLEPIAPADLRDQLQRTVGAIHAAQLASDPIRISATIGRNSEWHGDLFRKRFSIEVTKGTVSEIKLRCQKQYLFFKYQAGVEYSIGTKTDECSIEVVGDPDTRFDLVQ